MPDLKQELADVEAAIHHIEAQVETPAPAALPAPGKVRFRHPHSGDIKEVDATPEAMTPLMGLGYQQYKED
jgi:hypothetical protein